MPLEELLADLVLLVSGAPDFEIVRAQVVHIVFFQLFQAALGDDRQLMLALCGAFSVAVALHDVLFAGTGGLLHLVDGAVMAAIHESGQKIGGNVKHADGLLIDLQRLISVYVSLLQ